MKRFLIALAALLVVASGGVGALFMKWRPDEAEFRAKGWSDDLAKATAAATTSGRPLLVKFGSHG